MYESKKKQPEITDDLITAIEEAKTGYLVKDMPGNSLEATITGMLETIRRMMNLKETDLSFITHNFCEILGKYYRRYYVSEIQLALSRGMAGFYGDIKDITIPALNKIMFAYKDEKIEVERQHVINASKFQEGEISSMKRVSSIKLMLSALNEVKRRHGLDMNEPAPIEWIEANIDEINICASRNVDKLSKMK